jgi:hypothetical protein
VPDVGGGALGVKGPQCRRSARRLPQGPVLMRRRRSLSSGSPTSSRLSRGRESHS